MLPEPCAHRASFRVLFAPQIYNAWIRVALFLVYQQELQGAEVRTLGPVTSIRLKIENPWYASKGHRVQKLGPSVWFCGGRQWSKSWVNIPKTLNHARTVRKRPHGLRRGHSGGVPPPPRASYSPVHPRIPHNPRPRSKGMKERVGGLCCARQRMD